jgi:riboflavin kinase/FMN adenylyltransferase
MKIFNNLKEIPSSFGPIAVTLGNFDGVHLGHQALLRRLKELAQRRLVLTFSNHPNSVLQKTPITYLTTLPHRLVLLEGLGLEELVLIPFTEQFSRQTAKDFLTSLKKVLPFTHLVLGYDAIIGSDRNKDLMCLSKELSFTLEYLQPVTMRQKIVSSSEIRRCIQTGNLREASLFLGRPYSIFASVQHGQNKGGALGFHTANLHVQELTLPPLGVYVVQVVVQGNIFPAVANLGHAPTLHMNRPPCLEVHLIDTICDLYGQEIEVFFHQFIRPEQRFKNSFELKEQIKKDIIFSKNYFTS